MRRGGGDVLGPPAPQATQLVSLQVITEDFQRDAGRTRHDLRLISIGLAREESGGNHVRCGMTQINQEVTLPSEKGVQRSDERT